MITFTIPNQQFFLETNLYQVSLTFIIKSFMICKALPSLGLVSTRDLTSELRELSTLVDCCKRVLVAFPLCTLLGSDGGLGGSNPDSTSSSDGILGFYKNKNCAQIMLNDVFLIPFTKYLNIVFSKKYSKGEVSITRKEENHKKSSNISTQFNSLACLHIHISDMFLHIFTSFLFFLYATHENC